MAEEALRALQERLGQLEDLEEIRKLYIDYGRHLDAGDADSYSTLFSRAARLRLGPVARADGREQIREVAAKMVAMSSTPAGKTVHVLGSPRIELKGDTATGECVWSSVSDGSKVMVGRHVDELVREDGRWRFSKRVGLLDVGSVG